MNFPEDYRWNNVPVMYQTQAGDTFGMFLIPGRDAKGRTLKVMASSGEEVGWEHVSVSLADHQDKCPSWDEMCIVKGLFWDASECVVQFHPAESEYVNAHKGCLHLWKYRDGAFPTPPSICVGPRQQPSRP